MKEIKIRAARPEDAKSLLEIYAPYVKNTAISFEYEVPSVEEFAGRIQDIMSRYPYLIAEADQKAVGYAYAAAFKGRRAYDYSVESTIYIKNGLKGTGIGGQLYRLLEEVLRAQGILNMNSCIGITPRMDDPYLTNASREFHAHLGFREVGTFHESGYKFGLWYDMIWMEKMIGQHGMPAPVLRRFEEVRGRFQL